MNEYQILQKVEQTVESYGMLQQNDAVLVGVSGGPDSVALLHILVRLASKWNVTLGVAHLDHTLRKTESARDAQFVASLSHALSLPFYLQHTDVAAHAEQAALSLETAGRRARYAFYFETAQKENFNKIALGHHADDSAEVVLINLLRGSGPLGIAGIPPKRRPGIIRPLIDLKRADILQFLEKNKLSYVIDASNENPVFLRNRIRHQLLPHLADTYNPNVSNALNRLALIARSEEEWLDSLVSQAFQTIAQPFEDRIELSIKPLTSLHVACQRRLLRKAVLHIKDDLKRISYRHIQAVIQLLHHGQKVARIDLPNGLTVRRTPDTLLICRKPLPQNRSDLKIKADAPRFVYRIHDATRKPQTLLLKEIGMLFKWRRMAAAELQSPAVFGSDSVFCDCDKIVFPLTVRNFQPGDRFRPLGMDGSQKLKKYFINNKIPQKERRRIPILVSGNDIIWIAGHRMGREAKITAQTQNILKMELLLA
jgi:tRNA(Ile)-lysidine synthase